VLLALSSNQKLGIALAAVAFVAFALISAMLIPRYRPDFPAGRLGWFIAASVLFTVGMLTTVAFVAKETGEEEAAAETTTTTATATAPTTTVPTTVAQQGDAAAGKKLFVSAGCSGCHTFAPAGSTATVGPDLDNVSSDAQKANRGSLEQYVTESIEDPNAYVVPGFQPNVMPSFGSTLKSAQVADLVAFVTQG
jgi:mono/diheme cytochrome c family protein